MSCPIDVLGLGCVAVDDLLYVPAYPPADAKLPVRRRERQCGGLTATALVAASRLGARAAYAGVLGEDDLSAFVLERFRVEGIDTSWISRQKDVRPVASAIVVGEDTGTRNIFYDLTGAAGAAPEAPPEEIICSARVLLVDHFGVPGMIRAARIARAAGIPVVADLERDNLPGIAELMDLADHLVLSQAAAENMTGEKDPTRALARLAGRSRDTVAITCGAEGCYYLSGTGEAAHQPAFSVRVVDTTGCGDVFHGAYAAGLAFGMEQSRRIRFAAAAAALKATKSGGQAGAPTRAEVECFLAERDAPLVRAHPGSP